MEERSVRVRDQQGKGIIAFLIALVVVGYAGNALYKAFEVKRRAADMEDYVNEVLQQAEVQKWTRDQLRHAVVEKVKELEVPLEDWDKIEVEQTESRWRVFLEWDDEMEIPGYTHKFHFTIDRTWTRY